MNSSLSLIQDYLNNNRHKFDERGNFDPMPDERDYWPLAASSGGIPWWWKYLGGDKGPDDISNDRNAAEIQDWENGVRLTKKQCLDEYEKDLELCDDGQRGRAWMACKERAGNRLTNCYTTGSYNRQGRWTYQDATGQPQGDEDPDKRRKKKSGQNSQPQPNPKPEKKPDKTEFSLGSMFTNALTDTLTNTAKVALALNPGFQFAVDPSGTQSRMNSALRNFVMLPSDYPKGMQPLSKWSPQPATSAAVSLLPVPFGGAATLRVPTSPAR